MLKPTIKASKARIYVFFIALALCFTSFSPLKASSDDEITILKNKIAELEKRDIENRVLLTDIKDLLASLTLEIAALKEKIAKQEELLSAIPRRVPRPAESLEVEDTTPSEVPIENKVLSSPDSSKASEPVAKGTTPQKQNQAGSEIKQPDVSGTQTASSEKEPVIQQPDEENSAELSGDKKNLYNTASKFFATGAIDKAYTKFKEYIDKYPDDDLTDNAQYWIGECHLKKGEYLKAVEEFQKVIEYYPLGNKVPDAYLKIGYAYLYLKDNISALQYFNLVRDMFPHTDASIEAEKKIKEISKR